MLQRLVIVNGTRLLLLAISFNSLYETALLASTPTPTSPTCLTIANTSTGHQTCTQNSDCCSNFCDLVTSRATYGQCLCTDIGVTDANCPSATPFCLLDLNTCSACQGYRGTSCQVDTDCCNTVDPTQRLTTDDAVLSCVSDNNGVVSSGASGAAKVCAMCLNQNNLCQLPTVVEVNGALQTIAHESCCGQGSLTCQQTVAAAGANPATFRCQPCITAGSKAPSGLSSDCCPGLILDPAGSGTCVPGQCTLLGQLAGALPASGSTAAVTVTAAQAATNCSALTNPCCTFGSNSATVGCGTFNGQANSCCLQNGASCSTTIVSGDDNGSGLINGGCCDGYYCNSGICALNTDTTTLASAAPKPKSLMLLGTTGSNVLGGTDDASGATLSAGGIAGIVLGLITVLAVGGFIFRRQIANSLLRTYRTWFNHIPYPTVSVYEIYDTSPKLIGVYDARSSAADAARPTPVTPGGQALRAALAATAPEQDPAQGAAKISDVLESASAAARAQQLSAADAPAAAVTDSLAHAAAAAAAGSILRPQTSELAATANGLVAPGTVYQAATTDGTAPGVQAGPEALSAGSSVVAASGISTITPALGQFTAPAAPLTLNGFANNTAPSTDQMLTYLQGHSNYLVATPSGIPYPSFKDWAVANPAPFLELMYAVRVAVGVAIPQDVVGIQDLMNRYADVAKQLLSTEASRRGLSPVFAATATRSGAAAGVADNINFAGIDSLTILKGSGSAQYNNLVASKSATAAVVQAMSSDDFRFHMLVTGQRNFDAVTGTIDTASFDAAAYNEAQLAKIARICASYLESSEVYRTGFTEL